MKREITLTNREIDEILKYMDSDDYVFKKTNNRVPSKVSWAMFTNRKILAEAKTKADEFRTEIDNSYIDDEFSFVTLNDNGDQVRRVKDEYITQYSNEIAEFESQRVDLTFDTISFDDINKIEDCNIDDSDFMLIGFLIEENDDYIGPGHNKYESKEDSIEEVESEVVD